MKYSSLFSMALILGLSSATVAATPSASPAPAGCRMEFQVRVTSYVLYTEGRGTGKVVCKNADGTERTSKSVRISIEGVGPGIGEFSLRGVAGNLGILDPQEIEGTYAVLQANVGVHGAAGATLGFEGQDNGLSFSGSVAAGHGWGASLNGSTWTIRLL